MSLQKTAPVPVSINWLKNLPGDFSFKSKGRSIQCEAWCYEWAGTNHIRAFQKGKDTVACYTLCNAATHCSLQLLLTRDSCFASISLKSIVAGGDATYYCTGGFINIDQQLWKQHILKASFHFNFLHEEQPAKKMFWKGNIYVKISKKE